MAIDVLVGRPRTWVITGVVIPNALPMGVAAKADIAAMPKGERLDTGCLAQLFKSIVEFWLTGPTPLLLS